LQPGFESAKTFKYQVIWQLETKLAPLDEGAAQHGIHQAAVLVGAGVARHPQADIAAVGERAQFDHLMGIGDGVADVNRPRPLQIAQARRRAGLRHRLAAAAQFGLAAVAVLDDEPQADRGRVPARRDQAAE
jgi:hypothetical protein